MAKKQKLSVDKEKEYQIMMQKEKIEQERIKKKGMKFLRDTKIMDCYQELLTSLCKDGLPSTDIFEFSATYVEKYAKKNKSKK